MYETALKETMAQLSLTATEIASTIPMIEIIPSGTNSVQMTAFTMPDKTLH